MTEPTETERAELNARLARAMGIPDDRWAFQCIKEDHLLDGHGPHAFCLTCAAPVNKSALVPPDFTRDPAASRELVLWLKSQPVGIARHFIAESCHQLWPQDEIFVSSMRIDDLRFFDLLLASPLLIAIAADAATKEEG